MLKIAAAGIALWGALWLGQSLAAHLVRDDMALRDEARLALLVVIGALVYGGVILALFGRQWLAAYRRPAEPPL
jgi:putative peptidoglycan lipid II flippase